MNKMKKKIVIVTLLITLFINIKIYAFTINPAQYIISQSAIGVALSIKEEENNIANKEETKQIQEENFIDKIINWIKNLFRNDKD